MRCDFFRGLLMSCLDVRSNKVMMHSSAWNRRKHYGNQPAWQRPHDSAYPRKLQLASGSNRTLAKLYGLNPKTVAKWRASTSVLDEPMGSRDRASQHLSQEQEHLAIALR